MRPFLPLLLASTFACAVVAQSNTIPGTDGRLTDNSSPTYFGRRGPAHPNGEIGMSYSYSMCNPGSVAIPWSAPMNALQPMFAFMVVRESNGRMEQITNSATTYVKHAFGAANGPSSCGTCQSTGSGLRVGCSDTYGAGTNASRTYLGPDSEIDPWTGIWNPVGSYFDRGDPDVGAPGNNDGVRSLSGSEAVFTADAVKNRVTLQEQDLLVPGRLFHCMHIVVRGEDGDLHFDNMGHRQMTATWNGSQWVFANSGAFTSGSVLNEWAGARVNAARNGEDDGHFIVASKVTPIPGGFHYEYAVHNFDNGRGGAALRVPVAAGATVSNLGFRDTDSDLLNQWSMQRVGNEILFQATATNPLNWNNIFNFSFDCTQGPSLGIVNIDEARPGAGSLTVAVIADVPSGVPTAFNTAVGTGCAGGNSSCRASVYEMFATPAAFDLANSSMGLTFNGTNYALGPATGTFVAPAGTNLALTDDSQTTVNLPFTLSFPGGSTTQLSVCSNGFVSPVSNGTTFTPDATAFLGGNARWAAAWHDLNPTTAPGQVLSSVSPTAVRISWVNVASFSGTGSSHTFQYEFLPNNQVNIYWQTMTTSGNAYLVGWTAGHDINDPGSGDLSALIPAANLTLCPGSTIAQPLALAAGSRPVLGTTVQMTTSNVPAGSGAQGLVYSFTQAVPPVDLTSLGMEGCFAYVGPFEILTMNMSPATTVVDPVAIPNQNNLIGLTVTMQAISYSPPRTSFGWLSSNAILMFLAAQ